MPTPSQPVGRPSDSRSQPQVDHAARIVACHFDQTGYELAVGGQTISELADQFGTPLFIYDQDVMRKKAQQLRAALPRTFDLYYSMKANPNAAILRLFLEEGCGLEVASAGELFQALEAGCQTSDVVFAGPGKTTDELAAAVDAQIREIHVESIEEARVIQNLAVQRKRKVAIALRVNPIDAAGGAMRMGGKPSPFGIDEENLEQVLDEILKLDHVTVSGVHLFMGTQILDVDTLLMQYRRAVEIAKTVADQMSEPLKSIDFGGGLGAPCFPHESELDLAKLAAGLVPIAEQIAADPRLREARGLCEPGRFLVSEAGIYVSRVTRVKRSRGKSFAVIDGGMHHHLAASGNLGQTIKRNYPVVVANRLGVKSADSFQIVGPLCTPLDCLGRSVKLPAIEPGDLIAVLQSGAYARTASPHGFLSHDTPPEILITAGHPKLIRRRGTPMDLLRDQPLERRPSSLG